MDKNSTAYKVVIQLTNDDIKVHKSMVRQINNILKALEQVNIEVVTHGPGLELLLQTSSLKNNLELLTQKGVMFLVCQNTLNEKKIDISQLLSFSKIIPSGVAHIIVRQSEGWTYLKAGF